MRGKGTKLGEGEKGLGFGIFMLGIITQIPLNRLGFLHSGFLRSGLFCLGKVHGSQKYYVLNLSSFFLWLKRC